MSITVVNEGQDLLCTMLSQVFQDDDFIINFTLNADDNIKGFIRLESPISTDIVEEYLTFKVEFESKEEAIGAIEAVR